MHLKHFALFTFVLPVVLAGVIARSISSSDDNDGTSLIKKDLATRDFLKPLLAGIENTINSLVTSAENAVNSIARPALGSGGF
ncbi:hypothetical protein PM082_016528 [Marasmius tenuissimus]|nr:hypothetical protein PM082_016528 [Marasmius tenuissimus]